MNDFSFVLIPLPTLTFGTFTQELRFQHHFDDEYTKILLNFFLIMKCSRKCSKSNSVILSINFKFICKNFMEELPENDIIYILLTPKSLKPKGIQRS